MATTCPNRPGRTVAPEPVAGETRTVTLPGGVPLELVWCPPGEFTMGSPASELGRCRGECPQHKVEFANGFWMGKYPVTQAQWEAVMGSDPSYFKGTGFPVECVSWGDCQGFLDRLNAATGERLYRLPSEAEWEYACRAGTNSALYTGQELTNEYDRCPNLDRLAWYRENSNGRTHPVGQLAPNAWGLHDMLGNVAEWCEDRWHRDYEGAPTDGSAWTAGDHTNRVTRGDCWNGDAFYCRAAQRGGGMEDYWDCAVGFRLVFSSRVVFAPPPGISERDVKTVALPGGVPLELVWCPRGSFTMGSPASELGRYGGECPQHKVEFANGFWLGKYPVTQAQWEAVTGGNPSNFRGADRPVENVSWDDCQEFLEKLNTTEENGVFRLPSEAEWEYACRAGTSSALHTGEDLTVGRGRCPRLVRVAWYDANSGNETHPVGKLAANAWGLHDMLGNVWEWCEDGWHDSYEGTPSDGSVWAPSDQSGRVIRGGSWGRYARDCRAACRGWYWPDGRDITLGFRVAFSPTPSPRRGQHDQARG